MKSFIVGVVVGIIISTVGFSGVAQILDHGVTKVKTTSQELANEMNKVEIVAFIALILILLFILTGCNTVAGVGKDMKGRQNGLRKRLVNHVKNLLNEMLSRL
jgi:predicted small secreted protein